MRFRVWETKTDEERRRAARVTAASFSKYHSTLDLYPRWIRRYENWRSFVLSTEEADVAHIGVVSFRFRAGRSALRCAGLAWVGTDPRFQKRGWGRRLMEKTLNRLSEEGFHAAMLFGIPDYYHRFGFGACLPDYEQVCPSSLLAGLDAPHSVSHYRDKDAKDVRSIYNAHMKDRNASVIRTPKRWRLVLDRQKPAWISKDPRTGRATGYLAWGREGNRLVVQEAACRSLPAARSLLRRLGKKAAEEKAWEVQLNLPPDDPFARLAFLEGAGLRLHIHKNGGGMLASLRSDKAIETLSIAFADALKRSEWREKTLEFRVEGEQGGRVFRWSNGVLTTTSSGAGRHRLSLTSTGLVRAVTGFSSIDELLALGLARSGRPSLSLWRTLFPPGYPYVCPADRF